MNSRLANLGLLLSQQSLQGALISSPANILYLTNFSHFNHIEREAFLLIIPNTRYILTDSRYADAVKKHIKNFTLVEISSQNPLEKILQTIAGKEKILSLGIESNNITFAEYKKIVPRIKNLKHFDLTKLRMQKDLEEITAIQKACELGDKTFSYILDKIKPAMTEKEIALEMELLIRKNGAETSFNTIVAFGKNAAFPHHKTGSQRLKNNDTILLDFGIKYENYCSDMTRSIFFGKASGEKKRIYQTVLDAQQKAFEYLEKNVKKQIHLSSIDKISRDYIISQNLPTIPHSLGHGIGLEVHEAPTLSPKSKDILKTGMVFSIEPGIYLNNVMGVRIEDLVAIQDNHVLQLTQSPKNLIEL